MTLTEQQVSQDVSLLAQEQYLSLVRRLPQTTKEEEIQLLECIERGRAERSKPVPDAAVVEQAKQARDRLIEGTQWLVRYHAFRFLPHCRSMELLDLVQEGNLGLMEAIEQYRLGIAIEFRGSASAYIRRAMWKALAEKDRGVRLPLKYHIKLSKVRQMKQQLLLRLKREPSSCEIAAAIGISEAELDELLLFEQGQYVESIQQLSAGMRPEDHHDFLALYQETLREESQRQQELEQAVAQAIAGLRGRRQREVIQLKYGIGEGGGELRSLATLRDMLGVTSGCIEGLEQQAFKQMRPVLARYVALDDEAVG
jgi:RNA polymerase primary sigma factor